MYIIYSCFQKVASIVLILSRVMLYRIAAQIVHHDDYILNEVATPLYYDFMPD
jgi:hypothetical protein